MRDTGYARESITATLSLGGANEVRIERSFVKEEGEEEIRFSWWKNGNIVPRPWDLNDNHLLVLLQRGIIAGVFTREFREQLRDALIASLAS